MGGGGGSQQTYDPVFNAGLLALFEEDHELAKEYENFYEHGVLYDPNEEGYLDPKTNEWVPLSEALKKNIFGNSFYDVPKGAKLTKRGEVEGYDFDNPPASYMQMEQAQIDANLGLLPGTTSAKHAESKADLATADAQRNQAISENWQSLVDTGLTTGYNPITGNNVGPGELKVGSAEQSRDLAMYEADTRNVGYAEDAAREGYLTKEAQSQSDRAIIPYSQNEAISGHNYQTAMNEAQQGLISPWTEQVLSEYGYNTAKNRTDQELLGDYADSQSSDYRYNTAKNETETGLLDDYGRAQEAGYGYQTAKSEADRELIPGYQKATQSGYDLTYGKNTADQALLPYYQKAAQADYDLSYDTSQYGRQKIAGQTPILNRYLDKVNKGIDVGGRVNEASADVASSWKGVNQRTNMALEGMGVDPSSNRGRNAFSQSNMEYGRQMTTARQTARRQAENEDLSRMSTAINM